MGTQTASYTTAEIAQRVQGMLDGPADLAIAGVNAIDIAAGGDITFIADAAHAGRWSESRATAALISAGLAAHGHDPAARALIVVPSATVAMIELLRLFEPPPPLPEPGRHPAAWIHPAARLGRDVRIGPHASIDAGAIVGDRVCLHAGTRVYGHVEIGDDSVVHANAVIRERCRLGRRVVVHANATIGADGFGYAPAPDGAGLLKVPQIGVVEIGDDVEIGAGTCIDRAKFGATVIGAGTKIDNLVQIGHNCRIGRGCLIAALSGLAGSVTLGDGVRIGGAVGIADHIRVGPGASLGARAGVMRDVPAGATWVGSPAQPHREFFRQFAAVRRLATRMRPRKEPN